MSYEYYLPNEIWNKIMIMSYYLMAKDKKIYFNPIHRQLKLLFDDAYNYHIDKYIGYESFIICMDDDGIMEFDDTKIKVAEKNILYSLIMKNNLVHCITAMQKNRQEYT